MQKDFHKFLNQISSFFQVLLVTNLSRNIFQRHFSQFMQSNKVFLMKDQKQLLKYFSELDINSKNTIIIDWNYEFLD